MIRPLLVLVLAALAPQEIIDKAGTSFDKGEFLETVTVLDEALPSIRESGDTESLAECLSMLAVSYSRLGLYDRAISAQEECYRIDLEEGDPANISSSLNNLAGFCLAMENYDEAEKLIREAISYEEKLGESAALAVRYGMASDILLKQGKPREAVDYAKKALEMDQAAGRTSQAAVRKSQLAAACLDLGNLREARTLLDEAAEVFSATQNIHSLSVCRQQQGSVAAKMGRFSDAANYLREGLTLSRQTGNILLQRNISRDLAVILKDLDPRSAVNYMQDVVALSDSLFRHNTAQEMAQLVIQQDLSSKEKALADRDRALRQSKCMVSLLILTLLLLAALFILVHRAMILHKKNVKLLQKTSDIKDRLLIIGASNPALRDPELGGLMQELSDIGGKLPDKKLTSREQEIARLCCDGLMSKEIADRLNISVRTVETHKNNIFRKLGINTTAELARLIRGGGRKRLIINDLKITFARLHPFSGEWFCPSGRFSYLCNHDLKLYTIWVC